jgi:hypothetical protein
MRRLTATHQLMAVTLLCVAALFLYKGPQEFPQLTRLQLVEGGDFDVLDMVSVLHQLEILEIPGIGDIHEDSAEALSELPKLRTVNLSDSLLCESSHDMEPAGQPSWVPICECMPPELVEQLLRLRDAAPRINWVLEGMSCCDKQPPSRHGSS